MRKLRRLLKKEIVRSPPPPSKRRGSCALAELLGNTFGDARQVPGLVPPEKSAFDRAEEEVKAYSTAASLSLSENPLD